MLGSARAVFTSMTATPRPVLFETKTFSDVGIVGEPVRILARRHARLHLEGLVVDQRERLLRRRGGEHEVLLGRGDHAVDAREARHFVDHPLAVEIEHHERAVAEVGDVQAAMRRVDRTGSRSARRPRATGGPQRTRAEAMAAAEGAAGAGATGA